MPGSCNDCKNCGGFHDEGYGSGEYICKLDDTPEGCPEAVGNGPCPGWVPTTGEKPSVADPHSISFSLRDCIAVSVLKDMADTVGQMPVLDAGLMQDGFYPTFTLDLDFAEYCLFSQEFDWALAMECDMDQECGLNYITMDWEMKQKRKEAKQ